MIALDTNVLARWIANDDEVQADAAAEVFSELSEDHRGFINLVVMAELYWILRSSIRMPKHRIHEAIEMLLSSPQIEVEDEETVDLALNKATSGADFADALTAMTSELYGCTETVTFDRDAANKFGWRLLA